MTLARRFTMLLLKVIRKNSPLFLLVGGILAVAFLSGCDPCERGDESAVRDTLVLGGQIGSEYRRFPCQGVAVKNKGVTPGWDDAPLQVADVFEEAAGEIQFYLDLSRPIGGFVSPSDPDISAFSVMVDVVGRQLLTVFGEGGVPVQWYGFTDRIHSFDQRPRITRCLFDGGESDLTQALAKAQTDLDSGVTDIAVFLTDLMVTRDGFASPIHLPNYLAPWIGANVGRVDVTIVGAKLDYWGADPTSCLASGELGNWYNECEMRYVELESMVGSPIYLLVLARRTGDSADKVRDLTSRIKTALENIIGPDASHRIRSEIFTEQTELEQVAAIDIDFVGRRPTIQYDRNAANLTLWCVDDSNVTLSGSLRFLAPLQVVPGNNEADSTRIVEGIWGGEQLTFTIDCRDVRREKNRPITNGFTLKGQIREDAWNDLKNEHWDSWETANCASTGTVDLTGAFDRLRVIPDHYTLNLEQLFTFPESRNQ